MLHSHRMQVKYLSVLVKLLKITMGLLKSLVLLYILINTQNIFSSACSQWKNTQEEICDYDAGEADSSCCESKILICTDITDSLTIQYDNDCSYCNVLDISHSHLPFITSTMFSNEGACTLYKLILNNNHIRSIAKDTFADYSRLNIVILDNNEITNLDFLNSFTVIKELTMNNNSLNEIQADSFKHLENLEILKLSFNKLEKIGTEHYSLYALEELYLNDNNIQKIDDNILENLKKLHILSLSSNKLTIIGKEVFHGLEKLNKLYLDNNNIREIENLAFESLTSLYYLDLGNNQIKTLLRNMVSGLHNLEYLNLEGNPINTIVPETFLDLNKVTVINLNGYIRELKYNTFQGAINVDVLKLSGTNIKELKSGAFNGLMFALKLDGYYVSDSVDHSALYLNKNNLTHLVDGTFTGIKHIALLTLENNNIEKIEPGAFNGLHMNKNITICKMGVCTLNYLRPSLNLNNNKLKLLSANTFIGIENLELLHLENNQIKNIESDTFLGLNTLKSLNLKNNVILNLVPRTFTGLAKVEWLDLTNNKITALNQECFSGLTDLKHLLLSNNTIKDIFERTFKTVSQLQNLQLDKNNLTQFKSGTFSHLEELKYLNISYNNFSVLNDFVLFPLKNLESLNLDNNSFSYINYKSLLLHLSKLRFLSINDNQWSCKLLTEMIQVFKEKLVNYLFNTPSKYNKENVDGIFCIPDFHESKSINKTHAKNEMVQLNKDTDANVVSALVKNTDVLSNILHYLNNSAKPNGNSDELHQLINNISTVQNDKSENTKHSSLTNYLIIALVLVLCILLSFKVYMKYVRKLIIKNNDVPT